MRLSSQGEAFDRAAGFQPACPALDELLGLHVAIPAGHYAKATLRSPVLRVCEPPERRLQARLPAPLRVVNGQSREQSSPVPQSQAIQCDSRRWYSWAYDITLTDVAQALLPAGAETLLGAGEPRSPNACPACARPRFRFYNRAAVGGRAYLPSLDTTCPANAGLPPGDKLKHVPRRSHRFYNQAAVGDCLFYNQPCVTF